MWAMRLDWSAIRSLSPIGYLDNRLGYIRSIGFASSRFRDDILDAMDIIFSLGFLLIVGIVVVAFMSSDAGDSCCSVTTLFLLLITLGILAVFFGLFGIGCAAVILH